MFEADVSAMRANPDSNDLMSKNRTLKVAAGIGASFTGLVAAVILLLGKRIISFEMALLMLIALLALYLGFGILIAVYRLIGRLE